MWPRPKKSAKELAAIRQRRVKRLERGRGVDAQWPGATVRLKTNRAMSRNYQYRREEGTLGVRNPMAACSVEVGRRVANVFTLSRKTQEDYPKRMNEILDGKLILYPQVA